jgi:hypothetical protein
MQLGQPEPVCPLDDHHRRGRYVHTDLDDRRPDQHVQLPVTEPGHLRIPFRRLHPPVDHADAERVEQRAQSNGLGLGGDGPLALVGAFLDQRDDHERGVAEGGLLADLPPGAFQLVRAADPGPDLDTSRRRRAQVGNIEVGIEDLPQRPRDRRGRHQQHVRRAAAGLGLELAALVDTEAMLLVDDHEAQIGE